MWVLCMIKRKKISLIFIFTGIIFMILAMISNLFSFYFLILINSELRYFLAAIFTGSVLLSPIMIVIGIILNITFKKKEWIKKANFSRSDYFGEMIVSLIGLIIGSLFVLIGISSLFGLIYFGGIFLICCVIFLFDSVRNIKIINENKPNNIKM